MGKKKSKDPNGFPKKLYKLLGEGVAEEMNAMSSKELDATMVDAEEKIDEVEKAMALDPDILRLKDEMKDAKEPYTDVKKAQHAKIKYALYLKEQGIS